MWSALTNSLFHGQIQHRRLQAAAAAVLLTRLIEGVACWLILLQFYGGITVPAWAIHVNYAGYVVTNLWSFRRQRRNQESAGGVWFDILANLLPMLIAVHWTGGRYSPLLPTFVLAIARYGLIFGVDIGVQSLVATLLASATMTGLAQVGWVSKVTVTAVPLVIRQRLDLGFEVLIFGIIVVGGLHFFRILQDRETRLAETVGDKDELYQRSLRHQEDLRRLSQSVMQVGERTLGRISRELHDDLGQALTAVKIDLGLIERELTGQPAVRERVRSARDQIGGVLQSVRSLSQLLRPAVLDDLGLIAAMQSYITRFGERTRIAMNVLAPPAETRLPRPLEVAIYRVLQEALTNVARHAGAHNVTVCLDVDDVSTRLEVRDDGHGFDAASFLQNPPNGHGMGVIGMRERVAQYGGELIIDSRRGAGTMLALTIPLTAVIREAEERYVEDPSAIG